MASSRKEIDLKHIHSICIQNSEWEIINFKEIICRVLHILHFTRLDFMLL